MRTTLVRSIWFGLFHVSEPEKNDKGEQEGNALAWRFMLVGTIMLGER